MGVDVPYQPTESEPRPGETWKWMWLWVEIKAIGPKTVTHISRGDRTNGEVTRAPKQRFMRRFHRTGMTQAHPSEPADE